MKIKGNSGSQKRNFGNAPTTSNMMQDMMTAAKMWVRSGLNSAAGVAELAVSSLGMLMKIHSSSMPLWKGTRVSPVVAKTHSRTNLPRLLRVAAWCNCCGGYGADWGSSVRGGSTSMPVSGLVSDDGAGSTACGEADSWTCGSACGLVSVAPGATDGCVVGDSDTAGLD